MNIRSTLDELDLNAFEKAIDRIIQARAIYVLGLRASAPIAEFFVHYLKYIFSNVTVVSFGHQRRIRAALRIGEDDLLIGISFPRYTSRTIEAMEFAHSRGASLIAITDGAALALAFHGGRLPDGQERHGFVRRLLRRAALADQRPDRRPQPAAAAGGLRALCGAGEDLGQLRRLPAKSGE